MNNSYPKAYMYRRIVEAKRYIDNNYQRKIDLSLISNQANFSKYHFLRLFKASFGLSPHQYLTSIRLAHSEQLLKEGWTIKDISFEIGFESVPSFTKLFKKKKGISPRTFQKQMAAKQAKIQLQPLTFVPGCFAQNYGSNNRNIG